MLHMQLFYFYPPVDVLFVTSTAFLLSPPWSFAFDTKIKDCEVNVVL